MLRLVHQELAEVALTHHAHADAWRKRVSASGLGESRGLADSSICGRGLLLTLLERAGDAAIGATLRSTASGRPMVAGGRWHVSVSHADPFTAAAVARVPVGVDIETKERRLDWAAIVEMMFPPATARRIFRAPPGRRRDAFLEQWTRAEACAKINDGLVLPLTAEDLGGRHRYFSTAELIGCVVTSERGLVEPRRRLEEIESTVNDVRPTTSIGSRVCNGGLQK